MANSECWSRFPLPISLLGTDTGSLAPLATTRLLGVSSRRSLTSAAAVPEIRHAAVLTSAGCQCDMATTGTCFYTGPILNVPAFIADGAFLSFATYCSLAGCSRCVLRFSDCTRLKIALISGPCFRNPTRPHTHNSSTRKTDTESRIPRHAHIHLANLKSRIAEQNDQPTARPMSWPGAPKARIPSAMNADQ
jgi:hypothetical protein